MAGKWNMRHAAGLDFSHTTSFIIYFSRLWDGEDVDQFWIRMRIYRTTDSNKKWGGLGPEIKNSRIYSLVGR
jgi:hypothetical protein